MSKTLATLATVAMTTALSRSRDVTDESPEIRGFQAARGKTLATFATISGHQSKLGP